MIPCMIGLHDHVCRACLGCLFTEWHAAALEISTEEVLSPRKLQVIMSGRVLRRCGFGVWVYSTLYSVKGQ